MDKVLEFLNSVTSAKRGFILELFICEILFELGTKLRKRRWRALEWILPGLAVAAYFTLGYLLPHLKVPAAASLLIFSFSVLLQWIILDAPLNRTIFNSVAAYTVQAFTLNLRSTIISLLKKWVVTLSGWPAFLLKIFITCVVYAVCYFCLARKSRRSEMNIGYGKLYAISFISLLAVDILFAVGIRKIGSESRLIFSFALTVCSLLAMMYQFSAFTNSNLNKETAILERILYQEQKQHELTQETIDIINVKSHDLKRQMSMLKKRLGEEAGEMIGETEKAVNIYDCITDTGNKNLDLIVTEHMMYCRNHDIEFNVIADGKVLDFLLPADIYSLFGNALSNAVESVVLEEKENLYISLDVFARGEYVCIEVKNFCRRSVKFEHGRPITGKKDKAYHGYGIRSMEYIVGKYGGNMVIDNSNDTFTVKIVIQIPS